MQRFDSKASSMAFMKSMSWLGWAAEEGAMSHATGVPVPSGNTTTNPSACAFGLNCVVTACTVAPSARPCRSTTSGKGPLLGVGGVVSRYQRATPSTVMSWRCSATAALAAAGFEHPGEATGRPALPSAAPVPAAELPTRGDEQAPTRAARTRAATTQRGSVRPPMVAKHSTRRSPCRNLL